MKKLLILGFLVTSLQLNASEWLINRMQGTLKDSVAGLKRQEPNPTRTTQPSFSEKASSDNATKACACCAGTCATATLFYCFGPKACCCAAALGACYIVKGTQQPASQKKPL